MAVRRLLLWGSISAGIGIVCFWLLSHQAKEEAVATLQDRPGWGMPQIGGEFTLTDHHGARRSLAEFKGKYKLIYFGYSFCPDVCPLGLQNISQALERLGRDLDEVAPIFVTIDPARDTVENLGVYASNFHPTFTMLTGTQGEIDAVRKRYKVYAAKVKPDGTTADYLMDHSTLIYLMDRDGAFLKSFPHTIKPEALAQALTLTLAAEKKKRG